MKWKITWPEARYILATAGWATLAAFIGAMIGKATGWDMDGYLIGLVIGARIIGHGWGVGPSDEDGDAAARWRALINCPRIRMQGCAGFDPKTGALRHYSNETGGFVDGSGGYIHFGAEFWSSYPSYTESKSPSERAAENHWGQIALLTLTDDMMRRDAAEKRDRFRAIFRG